MLVRPTVINWAPALATVIPSAQSAVAAAVTVPSHASTTPATADDAPVITGISGAPNQVLDCDNACQPSALSQQFVRYTENSSKNIRRKNARMQTVVVNP